jgi:hypothetical protein
MFCRAGSSLWIAGGGHLPGAWKSLRGRLKQYFYGIYNNTVSVSLIQYLSFLAFFPFAFFDHLIHLWKTSGVDLRPGSAVDPGF